MKYLLRKIYNGDVRYEYLKEIFKSIDKETLYEFSKEVSEEKRKELLLMKNAFVPISVTGTKCELRCKHCNRHYLKHMIPAETNEELFRVASILKEKGINGIVLSGGSRKDGTVPLEYFHDAIKKIKEELRMKILAHTGPINKKQVEILNDAGLDSSLLDVVGSGDLTKRVFGIEIPVERYIQTINYINDSNIRLGPHVICGLDFGNISENTHELKALEVIWKYAKNLDTVVIVVLIPTKGTEMGDVPMPDIEKVCKIAAIANIMFDVEVALSCVRPGTKYRERLDFEAVKAGVTKIAVPSTGLIKMLDEHNIKYKLIERDCCALLHP